MLPFWMSLLVRTYAWLVLLQRHGVINTLGFKLDLWDAPLLFVWRLRAARIVYVLLITPMIVPLILVGIAVFYVYVKLKLVNTLAGIVLAHSMLAIPLVIIVISSALKSYDINQEMVARSLGASRMRAFFKVTLPQIRFGVITAALLSFLTSFDEVIVAIFVSGGANSTLTRNMFNALRDQIDPTIAAISTIMIAVTSTLFVLSQRFGRSGGKRRPLPLPLPYRQLPSTCLSRESISRHSRES